ncbi:MAG: ribbon-helix-helix protein, CopG family [Rubrobacter sp.]|nr:ribbon-helix-helix protein, CopG family [Rubrobacter sp.]
MNESEKDLVKEIWEHRDDSEEWSEEAEDIEVKPRRSSVVSFRLPPEEFAALEQARAQTGESLSEFIRAALTLRLRANAMAPILVTLGVTYGANSGLYEDHSDQILVHPMALNAGITIRQGGGTKASYIPKRSRDELLLSGIRSY